MKIIQYDPVYENDVKDLLVELQSHLVQIVPIRIQHCMVPPCIVPVFYHNIPAIVKKGDDSQFICSI